MFNGMFSKLKSKTTNNYKPPPTHDACFPNTNGLNDTSSSNSSAMRYSNMVNNSSRYIVTTYRAPGISGNVYPGDNPIFNGMAYIQGNLYVVPNNDIDRYNQGPSTGYLFVTRDITTVSGDVYTNNIYISGNLIFTNTNYGFKSNIYAPSLVSLTQTTTALYCYHTEPFQFAAFGQNNSNQILLSSTNESNLFAPSSNGQNDINNPFIAGVNSFDGYCTDMLWNGVSWVATGCGSTGSIAVSADGIRWSINEKYTIFNKGNTIQTPYGGAYTIEWNGTIWVAGGYGLASTLAYSINGGSSWSAVSFNPFVGGYCTKVKFNGNIWLASGISGAASLAYSYDGMTWQALDGSNAEIPIPRYFPEGCNFIEWNGDYWISGGNNAKMGYSQDGFTWTTYTLNTPSSFTTIRGAGWSGAKNMWIIVGESSQYNMAYSYEGLNWQEINDPSNALLVSAYSVRWFQKQGYWLATGVKNSALSAANTSIIRSTDGIHWENIENGNGLSPCYGITSTDIRTGVLYNEGSAEFNGEQVTVQNTLYVNGNVPTFGPNTGTVVIHGGISNTGNSYIGESLCVGGKDGFVLTNEDLLKGAIIEGNLFLGHNFYGKGHIETLGEITGSILYGTATSGTGLDISANAYIGGAISTADSAYIHGNAFIYQDVSMNGNLFVFGNTFLYKNLEVNGTVTTPSDISANGNLTIGSNTTILGKYTKISGNIDISRNATIDGNLYVGEDANIVGNIAIGGSFVTVNPYNISNTTDSTAVNVGALVVAGGIGISKSVVIGNTLTIQGNIESTSTDTGTLIINGGVGIEKSIFVGGAVNVKSGFNLLSTGEATSTGSGALSLLGGMGIAKSIYVGLNATILGKTYLKDSLYGTGNIDICGNLIIEGSSGLTITNNGGASITGNVNIVNGLNSLYVAGTPINTVLPTTLYANTDATFGKNAYVYGTTDSASTASGSLVVSGGVGIAKSVTIGGTTRFANTTNSTTTSNGSLIISGGVGIAKDVNIGGNLVINNYLIQSLRDPAGSLNYHTYLGSSSTAFSFKSGTINNTILGYNAGLNTASGGSYNTFLGASTNFDSNGPYSNSTAIGYNATITSSNQIVLGTGSESISIPGKVSGADSTSTNTGALIVNGGIGVSGNIYCGNRTVLYGSTDATSLGTGTFVVANGGVSIKKSLFVGSKAYIQSTDKDTALNVSGGVTFAGNTNITGILKVTNSAESYSIDSGSCVLNGGLGVGGSVNIQNTMTVNSSQDCDEIGTGTLVVTNGGASIYGNLYVGHYVNIGTSAHISDDLTVQNSLYVGDDGGNLYVCSDIANNYFINLYGTYGYEIETLNIGSTHTTADLNISGSLYVQYDSHLYGNLFLGQPGSEIAFDGVNFYNDSTFYGKVSLIDDIDAYVPNANNGSLYVKTGAVVGYNLFVGHETNSSIMKTDSLGIQYNFDNNTNVTTAFNIDGTLNIYSDATYLSSSTPTNITVPESPSITSLTSQINPSSDYISGGGIGYNGYMWVGVFNGFQQGNVVTRIYYSYDGMTWKTTNNVYNEFGTYSNYNRLYWNGVGWDGNLWVTCGYPADGGQYNNIMYSYDGFNWNYPSGSDGTTYQNAVQGFYGHDVASNGNMWVSVGRNTITSAMIYSYNGVVWKSGVFQDVSGSAGDSLDSVLSANGRIWVACGSYAIYYSYDGISWKRGLYNAGYNFHSLAWNGSIWICLGTPTSGNTPILYSSTDGISWSVITTNIPNIGPVGAYRYYKIVWNAHLKTWFMSSTNALLYSGDAVNWVEITNTQQTSVTYPCINFITNNVGNLNISGTIYAKDAAFSNKLSIADTSTSTSTNTGAVVVQGGVGIGSNLFVGGNTVIKTLSTGSVYSDANGVLSNNAPSDVRLKTRIGDLIYGLEEVLRLRPVSYNWKDQERFGSQREIGFIAQDVQEIIPEVVGKSNTSDMLTLDYPKLTAVLVRAIIELEERVESLERRVG